MSEGMAKRYTARKRNSRISPRKLRLAADMIRGKDVQRATDLLGFSVTKGSRIMGKLLASAISNAEQQSADIDSLKVAEVVVNNGMVLKRAKPSARGRMRSVYHRHSHIDLHLEEPSAAKTAPAPSASAEEAEQQQERSE